MAKESKTSPFAALRLGAFALSLLFAFGLIYVLSNFIEKNRVSLPQSYEDEDLSLQGKRLKGFALGAEGLIADWYWMWSLQYVGGKLATVDQEMINLDDLRSLNPRLLYPMLDNATDLDPKFMAAYSYGAVVLPAIDPGQAITLTEKGIRNNPDEWRLFRYLGYIHWRLKNYEKAAEIYEEGSRKSGAPSFFRLMAARMKTEGGSRETARQMYTQMLAEAQDQQTKESARFRLMQLDSLDEREAIDSALQTFRQRNGRCASSWAEILPQLRDANREFRVDAARNLVDPSDVPYILNREKCVADIDRSKSKISLQ